VAFEQVVQWREAFEGKDDQTPRWQTPLRESLSEDQMAGIEMMVETRRADYFNSLQAWREKMKTMEKRMGDNMDDRVGAPPKNQEGLRAIFEKSNETLNVVGGFADFAFSQAKNDLFASKPFFTARPVGKGDEEISSLVDKHSNWKLSKSNLPRNLQESLFLAFHLGTSFPKTVWRRNEETYERDAVVLVDRATKKPVLKADGNFHFIEDEDGEFEDEANFEFQRMRVTETERYYDNVSTINIGFRDIAWDQTAPEFDLEYTDVYHKYRCGLYDLAAQYELDDTLIEELRGVAVTVYHATSREGGGDREIKEHLHEQAPKLPDDRSEDSIANPDVNVCEGYLRVDIHKNGNPVRIFVVFVPALRRILFIDYLANVTPRGELPIKPVRIYREPGRVYGRGFHQKYEDVQDYIDANFNAATYHNRFSRTPLSGYDDTHLEENLEEESGEIRFDINKPYKLKPEGDINKAFQFATMPDLTDKTIELSGIMMEMAQLRTGISSAAQGEMSNLPQANTATGVRQLMSRSATLLRWPIDDSRQDLTPTVTFAVVLLYANHDRTETFTWGEGQNAEVLNMPARMVKDLDFDVSFAMVQAQNETKLESAQTGITIGQAYVNLPEFEKGSQRPLYIQAIKSLDFHDPEAIIRPAVLTFEDLLTQLPEELAIMLAENSPYHEQQLLAEQERQSSSQ